jgi:hypothetical protein
VAPVIALVSLPLPLPLPVLAPAVLAPLPELLPLAIPLPEPVPAPALVLPLLLEPMLEPALEPVLAPPLVSAVLEVAGLLLLLKALSVTLRKVLQPASASASMHATTIFFRFMINSFGWYRNIGFTAAAMLRVV